MTDREKQIEEMAKVLLETSCKGSECENCAFVKSVKEAKETCVCLKALYNAGYRKIPEDAVVLSIEEIKHPTRTEVIEFFVNHNAQVRKETAREILKELIKNCQYTFNSVGKPIIALSGDFALNVSKRYDVDIEE